VSDAAGAHQLSFRPAQQTTVRALLDAPGWYAEQD
jgi:hypothetical protein